ncbi:hypothetical protein [Halovivax cerinus]|uniref:hypothetical protein n=1 Tax=Halovivax cerinus TaxID=1487865 RepID=UPI002114D122|nr:hypothetical protein [Halovivax cerinus]
MKRRALLSAPTLVPLVGCTSSSPATIEIEELDIENTDLEPHTLGISISSSDGIVFHELIEIERSRRAGGTTHAGHRTLNLPELHDTYFEVTAIGPDAAQWDTSAITKNLTLKVKVVIRSAEDVTIYVNGRSPE